MAVAANHCVFCLRPKGRVVLSRAALCCDECRVSFSACLKRCLACTADIALHVGCGTQGHLQTGFLPFTLAHTRLAALLAACGCSGLHTMLQVPT